MLNGYQNADVYYTHTHTHTPLLYSLPLPLPLPLPSPFPHVHLLQVIGALMLPHLKTLNLSNNKIRSLDLAKSVVPKLTDVDLSNNCLKGRLGTCATCGGGV